MGKVARRLVSAFREKGRGRNLNRNKKERFENFRRFLPIKKLEGRKRCEAIVENLRRAAGIRTDIYFFFLISGTGTGDGGLGKKTGARN